MQNSIRQTASGDESGLKPAPDSQTGELKFFSSRGLFFFPDREAENCISSDCSADMTEAGVG